MTRFMNLSHVIEHGMQTCIGTRGQRLDTGMIGENLFGGRAAKPVLATDKEIMPFPLHHRP
ncbi:hypothetical protein [Sphingobium sp.]|uniref:hypothetical protein n=1 Tax=Sphingobium sp. TaxID=1912891 RepID=UPI002BF3B084|nr:hypothetical protein [Sphingobium sp.]HUD94216.1 hypothetical protein [Sphingobium sp.]